MTKYVLVIAFLFWAAWITNANADPRDQVAEYPSEAYNYEDVYCLAQNAYFESQNTSQLDGVMTSLVVLERVDDPFYPDTICEVVKQGSLKTGEIYGWFKDPETGEIKKYPSCQFSWYCDGKSDDMVDPLAAKRAFSIVWLVLNTPELRVLADGATHYHAHYVDPPWAGTYVPRFVGSTDGHKFWAR